MNQLVDHFFPILEQFMGQASFQSSENYTHMMTLIAKIFFISVQVSLQSSVCISPRWLKKARLFFLLLIF